jgi:glutamate-1-semialdehyde aminotransferase
MLIYLESSDISALKQKYATEEVIPQSTYARNPVSLAAADATLEDIKRAHVHSIMKSSVMLLSRVCEKSCRTKG